MMQWQPTRYTTICLPLACRDGWYSVDAELVHDIAPHLAHVATFAVHRLQGSRDYWQCTHVETGLLAGNLFHASRDAAIEATRIVLATKTPADIAAAVRAAVKRAPWIVR